MTEAVAAVAADEGDGRVPPGTRTELRSRDRNSGCRGVVGEAERRGEFRPSRTRLAWEDVACAVRDEMATGFQQLRCPRESSTTTPILVMTGHCSERSVWVLDIMQSA